MKIIYYVHDLKFPLVEGVRKQAWWLAKEMVKKGHKVEILSTSKYQKKIIKEGIKISYSNPWKISKSKADIIHHVSHPSPLNMLLMLRGKSKKQILTFYDGKLNSFWKRSWARLLIKLVNKKIDLITVQTDYQRNLLRRTKVTVAVKKIPPLIPSFKRTCKRDKNPTLLFMSHLTEPKGIAQVLKAFKILKKDIPKLKLVIANSGLKKSKYNVNMPGIVKKKVINPEEELSKAWVYLYPITQAQETFSVPLSLIESLQVGTAYISTLVGGIPEYFSKEALVKPRSVKELVNKIRQMLHQKPLAMNKQINKQVNNKKVVKEYLKIYQN